MSDNELKNKDLLSLKEKPFARTTIFIIKSSTVKRWEAGRLVYYPFTLFVADCDIVRKSVILELTD